MKEKGIVVPGESWNKIEEKTEKDFGFFHQDYSL